MFLERSTAIQQRQSLTVSNNLIQSLRILQFRQDELSAYLEDQAERNPFIDLRMPLAPRLPSGSSRASEPIGSTSNQSPKKSRELARQDTYRAAGGGVSGGRQNQLDPDAQIAATCRAQTTLREHLHQQIALTLDTEADRAIAVELADNIDPDGYMRTDPDLIAETLDTDTESVLRILSIIQGFEPAGIGARTLAECLRLQLASRNLLTSGIERLLENLDLLAKFEISKLASLTRSSQEAVIEMARLVRTLDPKPGHRFDADPVMPALPDILAECDPDGEMRIELNSELLPRVLVDRQYFSTIKLRNSSEEDRKFVADCMSSASFLARCLDQRAKTLLTVVTEIASRQRQFLLHGKKHLRPLCLKDVAQSTGYHESTVCRAIANKFIMTPHGMYDLRFFFSNAVGGSAEEDDHSAEKVRHQIRTLVEQETADAVLSDGQIVDALKADGIDLARRTVAKYRDMMRIPSSLQRRREKRARTEFNYA